MNYFLAQGCYSNIYFLTLKFGKPWYSILMNVHNKNSTPLPD